MASDSSRDEELKSSSGEMKEISLIEAMGAPRSTGADSTASSLLNSLALGNSLAGLDSQYHLSRSSIADPAAMMLRRQQNQEHQLIATRMLLQQQQQDNALLGAARTSDSFLGTTNPLLLGNSVATRAGLEQATQAALLAQQSPQMNINLLRAQIELAQLGAGFPNLSGGKDSQPLSTLRSPGKKSSSAEDVHPGKPNFYDSSNKLGVDNLGSDGDDEDSVESDVEAEPKGVDAMDTSSSRSAATETFPSKLYRMIEEADKTGMTDIVSFFSHGRAFAIHKPRQFISELMPKYFSTSRMSSFQRQLNLYGFRRITDGRDKGGYYHDYFVKGRKKLCRKIKRKRTGSKLSLNPPQINVPSDLSLAAMAGAQAPAANMAGRGFNASAMRQLQLGLGTSPMLHDAANLYQMQMLRASGGIPGAGSLLGSTSGMMNSLDSAAAAGLISGNRLMGSSAGGPGTTRSPASMNAALNSDLSANFFDQHQSDLLLLAQQQLLRNEQQSGLRSLQQQLQQQQQQRQQQQQKQSDENQKSEKSAGSKPSKGG